MSKRLKSLQKLLVSTAIVSGMAFLLAHCNSVSDGDRSPENDAALWPDKVPSGRISFQKHVKPLLEDQCLECHNHVDAGSFAGLNLETRSSAFNSGRNAPVIIPGDPEKSLLIQVLKLNSNHPTSMPAAQEKVEGARLAILEKWIRQGAEWPNDARLIRPQDLPARNP